MLVQVHPAIPGKAQDLPQFFLVSLHTAKKRSGRRLNGGDGFFQLFLRPTFQSQVIQEQAGGLVLFFVSPQLEHSFNQIAFAFAGNKIGSVFDPDGLTICEQGGRSQRRFNLVPGRDATIKALQADGSLVRRYQQVEDPLSGLVNLQVVTMQDHQGRHVAVADFGYELFDTPFHGVWAY